MSRWELGLPLLGVAIVVAAGLALIVFRALLARYVVAGQNRFWGPDFLGRDDQRISEVIISIVGLGFIFTGVLLLSRVVG